MQIDKQQPMRECEVQIVDYINAGSVASLDDVNDAVNVEKERAIAREDELETEITRATDKENELEAEFDNYAPLNSPTLTGTPTAPTATSATSSTQIATTEFVENALNDFTPEIADESITGDKLASQTITGNKIANYAITRYKFGGSSIYTESINDRAVTGNKLALNSITTNHIIDLQVTTGKIKAYAVTTPKIADGAVTTLKIADEAVTLDKLDSKLSTLVSFIETLPNIEWGYSPDSYTLEANATLEVTVNFSSTKTEPPSVFVDTQANVDALILSSVKSVTTSQFVVLLKNESNTSISNITFDYLALSAR